MTSNSEITAASLEKPEVQLMDCGQHLLHIVGQITITFKLDSRAKRIVKVLINTDNSQSCLLGTNAQEELGFTLIHPDGHEIPRSPAPTLNKYNTELAPPVASTFTVRLLKTCRIPGYRGWNVKAKVEGDWNQIQSKGAKCFLFEPNRETLQRYELDAESSLLDPVKLLSSEFTTTATLQP